MTLIATILQVSGPLGEVTLVVDASGEVVFTGKILLHITPIIGHKDEHPSKVTLMVDIDTH